MSYKVHNNVLYLFACNQNLHVHLWWDLDKFPFTSIMAVVSTRRPVSNIPAVSGICPWLIPWRVRDQVHLWLTVTGFRLMVFFDKIIVGHHGVPHPPSLTQMAFIKCTSMSELGNTFFSLTKVNVNVHITLNMYLKCNINLKFNIHIKSKISK